MVSPFCEASIPTPNGFVISKDKLIYLGSLLTQDASITGELNRKRGAAKNEQTKFGTTARWRKLSPFTSLIEKVGRNSTMLGPRGIAYKNRAIYGHTHDPSLLESSRDPYQCM